MASITHQTRTKVHGSAWSNPKSLFFATKAQLHASIPNRISTLPHIGYHISTSDTPCRAKTTDPTPTNNTKLAPLIFSGIQPTGTLHLGNYLGSIQNWIALQRQHGTLDSNTKSRPLLFSVVDLHALTLPQDPQQLRQDIRNMATMLLACGLDHRRCVLFRQSQVPEHAQLHWLLSCLTPMGWLNRMTQWKSKLQAKKGNALQNLASFDIAQSGLCLGLFAYPTLQASDILLYRATHVPVGEDQLQHLELARGTAELANRTVQHSVFPLPQALLTPSKRIMSLRQPQNKMSKSDPNPMSRIQLDDPPEVIRSKVRKAVSDSISVPSYDPVERPGVSNMVEIYASLSGLTVEQVCAQYATSNTQQFKQALAEVIIEALGPIQRELARLQAEPGHVDGVLRDGAQQARELASVTYREFADRLGLD
ncbi:Tryptophan--tRNA ligase, mitochondrial [Dispira simplex]|nr:Tryptophan--tRNA ligase, mitochondrial [Dispira simplex]